MDLQTDLHIENVYFFKGAGYDWLDHWVSVFTGATHVAPSRFWHVILPVSSPAGQVKEEKEEKAGDWEKDWPKPCTMLYGMPVACSYACGFTCSCL